MDQRVRISSMDLAARRDCGGGGGPTAEVDVVAAGGFVPVVVEPLGGAVVEPGGADAPVPAWLGPALLLVAAPPNRPPLPPLDEVGAVAPNRPPPPPAAGAGAEVVLVGWLLVEVVFAPPKLKPDAGAAAEVVAG